MSQRHVPHQNYQHDTRCNLMLRHVACDTPVPPNGTVNELTIKMTSQGRPVIGLFTELSQQHVASACHTRGWNVHATFCCRDLSPEFKRISIHATRHCTTCRSVKLHKNIHVTLGDLSQGRVTATSRGDRSPRVTVPLEWGRPFYSLTTYSTLGEHP